MGKLTKGEIPAAVKGIESRPVVHSTVCNKEDMEKEVRKFLNL
jgi:hypothetical protein